MALISGGLDAAEVCGVVVSVRYQEDILSIWNRSSGDEAVKAALKEAIKKCLGLPASLTMEYKAHDAAMKDNSSYRNTSR